MLAAGWRSPRPLQGEKRGVRAASHPHPTQIPIPGSQGKMDTHAGAGGGRPVQLVLLTSSAGRPGRRLTTPLWQSLSVKADLSVSGSEGSELKNQRKEIR